MENISWKDKIRFWSKILIDSRADACWNWQAAKDLKHYGKFMYKGRTRNAHRVAWTIENGPIPDGLFVLHHCDNPSCQNPSHLWLGTNADNVADMMAKGRQQRRCGSGASCAKLAEDDVRTIRRRRAAGERTIDLAAEFGISPCTISNIVARRSWKHI